MAEIVRWAFFCGLLAGGWFVSRRLDETARTIARRAAIGCASAMLVVVATGIGRVASARITDVHLMASQLFGILTWLGVPFSVGTLLERRLRGRPFSTIVQCWVLLSVVIVGWSASVTGYLGPTHDFAISEETRNRFLVVHLFVSPTVTCGLLFAWWRAFRVRNHQPATDDLAVVES